MSQNQALQRYMAPDKYGPVHIPVVMWMVDRKAYRLLTGDGGLRYLLAHFEKARVLFTNTMRFWNEGYEVRVMGPAYNAPAHPTLQVFEPNKDYAYWYWESPLVNRPEPCKLIELEHLMDQLGTVPDEELGTSTSLTMMSFYLDTLALCRKHKAGIYSCGPRPGAPRLLLRP